MGNTLTWETLPTEKDGWVRSHNALRLDMKDLSESMALMHAEAKSSGQIDAAKTDALLKFWNHFVEELHEHHDGEEKIFFPNLAKRVQLPPKLSASHATLEQLLSDAGVKAKHLPTLAAAKDISVYQTVLAELLLQLQALQRLTEEHFDEEEQEGIPLMRQHFTRAEVMVWVNEMVRKLPWYSLPHMLRPFPGEDLKRDTMVDMGIPRLVVSVVLMPRMRKYAQEYEAQLTLIRTPRAAPARPAVVSV
jgi:hemerythrin-like domain-containing protein